MSNFTHSNYDQLFNSFFSKSFKYLYYKTILDNLDKENYITRFADKQDIYYQEFSKEIFDAIESNFLTNLSINNNFKYCVKTYVHTSLNSPDVYMEITLLIRKNDYEQFIQPIINIHNIINNYIISSNSENTLKILDLFESETFKIFDKSYLTTEQNTLLNDFYNHNIKSELLKLLRQNNKFNDVILKF